MVTCVLFLIVFLPLIHQSPEYRGYIEEGRTSEGKPRLIYLGSLPSSMYLRNIQETWLICDPKEAKLSNIPFGGPRSCPPESILLSLASFGPKQPGFSPQAINIQHPDDQDDKSICEMIWPYHPNHTTYYYMP